jgi:membrane-associated protein
VPIVRTFAPVAAGVAMMEYKRFVTYNVFGGFRAGAPLGTPRKHHSREGLEPAVLVIVLLPIPPLIIEWWRHRSARREPDGVAG